MSGDGFNRAFLRKKDHRWVPRGILVLLLCAAGRLYVLYRASIVVSERREKAQSEQQEADRKFNERNEQYASRIRELIRSSWVVESAMTSAKTAEQAKAARDIKDKWAEQVAQFLGDTFGTDYVLRFREIDSIPYGNLNSTSLMKELLPDYYVFEHRISVLGQMEKEFLERKR